MRWRGRLVASVVLTCSLCGLCYFAALDDRHSDGHSESDGAAAVPKSACPTSAGSVRRVRCDIEGTRSVDCYRDSGAKGEIFVPFYSFLQQQFDVNGSYDSVADVFQWRQSYAAVKNTDSYANYGPKSVFGPFAGYHVERRALVRCIDGIYGVPMSVQWSKVPYYYPIQIAQYALEHYSKNITEEVDAIDEFSIQPNVWKLSSGDAGHALRYTQENNTLEIGYSESHTSAASASLSLQDCRAPADGPARTVLHFAATLGDGAEFSVLLQDAAAGEYVLHYVQAESPSCVYQSTSGANEFYYALGRVKSGTNVYVRDLLTDINRALATKYDDRRRKLRKMSDSENNRIRSKELCIRELHFTGHVSLSGNVQLRSSAHEHMFLAAANWFVHKQDSRGGWPVGTKRSLAEGRLTLPPGWYSAMAQGHAMSVLCRAFLVTQNRSFLDAALEATKLFHIDAAEKGIRNKLFGKFDWYEEYPTVPGSFVLNGFMYSLVGLFDLMKTAQIAHVQSDAGALFEQGLNSLLNLLPMYDMGGRTLYDLRHVSLGSGAPNIARWDYHALHVLQLRWIAAIVAGHPDLEGAEGVPGRLEEVAERWLGYAKGQRAKHN